MIARWFDEISYMLCHDMLEIGCSNLVAKVDQLQNLLDCVHRTQDACNTVYQEELLQTQNSNTQRIALLETQCGALEKQVRSLGTIYATQAELSACANKYNVAMEGVIERVAEMIKVLRGSARQSDIDKMASQVTSLTKLVPGVSGHDLSSRISYQFYISLSIGVVVIAHLLWNVVDKGIISF